MAHRTGWVLAIAFLGLMCWLASGLGSGAGTAGLAVRDAAGAAVTAEVDGVAAPGSTPDPAKPPVATGSPQVSPGETRIPPAPSIAYFTCAPCVVEPGSGATLSWDLSGATAAYLDGQGITAPGSMVVYPDQSTTYQLVAINDQGRSERTVTVEVRGLPTIHYFTCLPCEIAAGEPSTLSWDLSGATAAYLDGQGVPAPGNTVVAPGQTTTYRLVAVSEGGSVERLVTVTVKEGGDPGAVSDALRQSGYDVRWAGSLPLERGGNTISVLMVAAPYSLYSQEIADQYYAGFRSLYANYPDQILTVGMYDGVRYMHWATVEPATFEAFLRGEIDGQVFWKAALWNVWDEWTASWLGGGMRSFADQDFVSKSFGY